MISRQSSARPAGGHGLVGAADEKGGKKAAKAAKDASPDEESGDEKAAGPEKASADEDENASADDEKPDKGKKWISQEHHDVAVYGGRAEKRRKTALL